VSHSPERAEKNCLNCGAQVMGPYCQVCGQHNIEPKESFWGLITHFVYDITHFDGKFFSTLKFLIFKPGFLTREYVRGRRVAYLHPIRMYIFIAAFFFIIFFNFMSPVHGIDEFLSNQSPDQKLAGLSKTHRELEQKKSETNDTVMVDAIQRSLLKIDASMKVERAKSDSLRKKWIADSLAFVSKRDSLLKEPGRSGGLHFSASTGNQSVIRLDTSDFSTRTAKLEYPSVEAYDAIQSEMPEDRKDHGFKRMYKRKLIYFGEKSNREGINIFKTILERFLHFFPQIFFISLPLFALILKLLYFRHKQISYVDHGIFAIHLYCASFVIILAQYLIVAINTPLDWMVLRILSSLVILSAFFYEYKAMRNFYQQSRIKTILKWMALNSLAFLMIFILMGVFLVFSAIQS